MNLLQAWANWQPASPPFVLDGDIEMLNSHHSARAVITHRSWGKPFRPLISALPAIGDCTSAFYLSLFSEMSGALRFTCSC